MHLPDEIFDQIASLINKAKVENDRRNHAKALEFYQKAEAAFPQPAELYTGACFLFCSVSEALLQIGHNDEALSYATRAAACSDGINDAKVYYLLGLIHLRKDQQETAKTYFKKAFALASKTVFVSDKQEEITFFKEHIFQEHYPSALQ
jgi:tetratricopeptide (TPR) repeat protein